MTSIIREADLLAYGLYFIRVEKFHIESYVKLDGEISDFIEFCRQQSVNAIFYKYTYYDREEYTVTTDLLSHHTENKYEQEFCSSWAVEYNQKTQACDFENPFGLSLCASVGTLTVVFSIQNPWMTIEKAEDALTAFLEDHEEELLNYYEYESTPSLMDELTDILLSDKAFRYCTNKSARTEYMERFMAKKNNKRFWTLAKGATNEWDRRFQINTVVNQIYNEYRNRCYKLKIQVGEELPVEK